jgi:hypothetical protein
MQHYAASGYFTVPRRRWSPRFQNDSRVQRSTMPGFGGHSLARTGSDDTTTAGVFPSRRVVLRDVRAVRRELRRSRRGCCRRREMSGSARGLFI